MKPFLYLTSLLAAKNCYSKKCPLQMNAGRSKTEPVHPLSDDITTASLVENDTDYTEVNNQLVTTFVQNNPRVREIDLSNCTSLSNHALWAIADACNGYGIRRLVLSSCKLIDDNGLAPIAKAFGASMSYIDIEGLPKVTMNAVAELAEHNDQLKICTTAEANGACDGVLIVAETVANNIKEVMGDKDPATHRKLALLLDSFPEASSIILPYTVDDKATSSMLMQALYSLGTLVKGGLRLNKKLRAVSIDLTITPPDGIEEPKKWLTAKHFDLLLSMPGDCIQSLNLQDTGLGGSDGAKHIADALPKCK